MRHRAFGQPLTPCNCAPLRSVPKLRHTDPTRPARLGKWVAEGIPARIATIPANALRATARWAVEGAPDRACPKVYQAWAKLREWLANPCS